MNKIKKNKYFLKHSLKKEEEEEEEERYTCAFKLVH